MTEKQVVFITGAASGIGYEIGTAFAGSGASVVFTDINEEKVKQAAADVEANGYDCMGLKCDVTKEEELKQDRPNGGNIWQTRCADQQCRPAACRFPGGISDREV